MRSKRDDVLFKRVNTNELLPSVVFVVKTDSLVVNNHVFFFFRAFNAIIRFTCNTTSNLHTDTYNCMSENTNLYRYSRCESGRVKNNAYIFKTCGSLFTF